MEDHPDVPRPVLPEGLRKFKEAAELRLKKNPRGPQEQLAIPGTKADLLQQIQDRNSDRLPYKD